MNTLINLTYENKFFFIAMISAGFGASARIGYERDDVVISPRKIFSYYITSFFLGYLIYLFLDYKETPRLTAIFSALAGLVSMDIIKILIDKLPIILGKILDKLPDFVIDLIAKDQGEKEKKENKN